MRFLVVEDNARLGPMLVRGLEEEGHVAELATDGGQALELASAGSFDAIVLDLMLPVVDGMGVLDQLRARGDATPVLILTAKDEVDDRVGGLDRGADDYLTKPFSFDELLARLRAIVRRVKHVGTSSILRVADLEVDTTSRTVRRGRRGIVLSAREYAILECLMLRKDRVVSREALLATVYSGDEVPESNVLEVFIGTLRRKIDRDHPVKLIHTRRGMGYVLGEAP